MPADAASTDMLSRIAASAARFPRRAAHVSPDGTLTYAELMARSAALARHLAAQPSLAPVLVYGHKEPAMPVAFLACARSGRAYVPADAGWPPDRVARIARLAGARVCVAARPLPEELAAHLATAGIVPLPLRPGGEAAGPEAGRPPAEAPPGPPAPVGAPEPAYIIFTSGSTGDPKGVPIPWGALAHFAGWLLAEQAPEPGAEVVLNQAPFSFDLSVMDLYLSLLSGGTLFSVTSEMIASPRDLFAGLAASGVSTWVSTPSFARFCLAEPRFSPALLPRLRRFLFCGETLPPAILHGLADRFPGAAVWNTYGPTETTVAVTSVRLDPGGARTDDPLPVGRPAPGMRVFVAGPDLSPLTEGQTGEIVIGGPQVSPGYLAPSPETGAVPPPPDRFVALPPELGGGRAYRTGDAGRLAGGLLYCDGRLDRQIKLHGYRLELDEIEAHLRALPGVADAAVLPVPRGGAPEYLVAFVHPADIPPAGTAAAGVTGAAPPPPAGATEFQRAQDLRRALLRSLPAYAVPRVVRFVAALPLTGNGKIDRRRLEELLG